MQKPDSLLLCSSGNVLINLLLSVCNKLTQITFYMQFYKNLSNSLDDVVWKTDEDMREVK